jgi:hypothetical protein
MSRKQILLLLLISILIGLITRFPTRTKYLYSSDSVQFALAMDNFNIIRHQPHPPGYLLFVWAGKALRLFTVDANDAFILWNILAFSITALIVFCFAYDLRGDAGLNRALVAWFLCLANVLTWFHSSTAEIYISELFTTSAVAYFSWLLLRGNKSMIYILPITLAVCGAFKLTGMIFLAPLAIYALLKAPVKKGKLLSVFLFLFCISAFFVPIILRHGISAYFHSLWETFALAGTGSSVFSGRIRALVRNFRDVAYYCSLAAGLINVAILFYFVVRRAPGKPEKEKFLFFSLWCAPYLLFFIFVHIANIGYVLPLVAPFAILIADFFSRRVTRAVLLGIATLSVFFSVCHFLIVSPVPPLLIGEGLEFQQKTWRQRVLSQVNLFTYPTRSTLRKADAIMEWMIRAEKQACQELEHPILITAGDHYLSWRKLQYYFPQNTVVRLYDPARNPFMIARYRNFVVKEERNLNLDEGCAVWILADQPSIRDQLLQQTGAVKIAKDEYEILITDACGRISIPPDGSFTAGCAKN